MNRLFLLADLIIGKGVALLNVLELLLYTLPSVIAVSVPLAILSGSIMVFGRLSQDNEIIAIRAGGVNPGKIFKPFLGLNIAIAVLMGGFDGFILPEGNYRARNLLSDISRKRPAIKLEEGIFNVDFPEYTIYIGKKDEKKSKIYDVLVYQKKGKAPILAIAKEGKLSTTPDEKYLQMTLLDSEVHELTENGYRKLSTGVQTINFEMNTELIRRERKHRADTEMSFPLLIKEAITLNRKKQEEMEKLEKILATQKNSENNPRVMEKKAKIESLKRLAYRYLVEANKMIVFPIAGLIFLYLGASLGVKLRKGGMGLAIILALIFFAVYYVLLIAGEDFADRGKINPCLAIWLPNLIFLPIALELYNNAFNECSFFKKLFRK